MQIKRYEAKDMTAALRLIKNELGPEAVILSARSLRKGSGIFGAHKHCGVEVTAATDTHSIQKPKMKTFLHDDGNGGPMMMSEKTNASVKAKGMSQNHFVKQRYSSSKRDDARLRDHQPSIEKRWSLALYHQLLSQDVDAEIAADVIEGFKIMPDATEKFQHGEIKPLLATLFSHMGVANGLLDLDRTPPVVALIGTTGVGKTSMIAKLAAHYTLEHNKYVALLTIDDYRIGAIEQLNAYARIIGLPLERASTPNELKARLKEFKKYDLILIDTPGFSLNNTPQMEEISSCLEKIHHIQIQLVLSAGTKQKDLLNTIRHLRPIGAQQLIFTKLDESVTYGNLLNILLRSNLPMSFFSRGQQIPDDIEVATIETLVDLIMSKSPDVDLGQSDNDPGNIKIPDRPLNGPSDSDPEFFFVANKNSDVYHLAGCKWTKKIKQHNVITFESAAAAEQKKYLPCRNCNPDRSDHSGARSFARDKKNIALY